MLFSCLFMMHKGQVLGRAKTANATNGTTTDAIGRGKVGRRKKPPTADSIRFGALLAGARRSHRCTQDELAKTLGLSVSYLAKIEGGRANHEFTRDQVWDAIKLLKIWPPKCDEILESAGFSVDRTIEEELFIQQNFPDLREVWVFARHILDSEEPWLATVRANVQKGVSYRYFTGDDISFSRLLAKLRHSSPPIDEPALARQLECFLIPNELFFTNVAIYNPGSREMYCCGAKTLYGKGEFFFTNRESESQHIYTTLEAWADRIRTGEAIRLLNAQRVFPAGEGTLSVFSSKNPPK